MFVSETGCDRQAESGHLPGNSGRGKGGKGMCQWYGDLEPLEKEASEEPAVLRREIDMAAMMPEDWDQIMGGPEDRELGCLD